MRGGVTDVFVLDLESRPITNITKDSFADYAPTWTPDGRALIVADARQRQREAVPGRARRRQAHPAHLRHPRRGRRPVPRRSTPWSSPPPPSTPTRRSTPRWPRTAPSTTSGRSTSRPASSAATPTPSAGNHAPVVLKGGATTVRASPSSATTRATTACTSSIATSRSARPTTEDFGAPGPIVDFQAPLTHTLVDRQRQAQGQVREALPRGPAAGEHRPDQRRRLPGRHRHRLHRRARRPAVHVLRRLGLAVPLVLGVVPQPRTPLPVRAAGLHADAVLLRAVPERLLRPGRSAASSTATWPSATQTSRGGTAFAIWPFNRYRRSSCPAASSTSRSASRTRPSRTTRRSTRSSSSAASCSTTARWCRSASPSCRRRRCSASSARWPATPCGCPTRSRRASAASCRGRPVDLDARKYFRLGGSGLLALRARGFKSWGDNPGYYYFGGNSRDARLRVPRVRRPERRPPQRRAAHPADPRHGHADRHPRRRPRHALRQRRRRLLRRTRRSTGGLERHRRRAADHRLRAPTRPTRRHRPPGLRRPDPWCRRASAWSTRGPATASACRPSRSASRSTSTGAGARSSTRTRKTCTYAQVGRQRRCSARPKFTVWIGYDF